VLRPVKGLFDPQDYPDLLVGLNQPDDAAVWRIDDSRALVLTTDFFTPVVDDPYDYGAIAAANSLSDVYAMGGEPFLALNIAAVPPQLDEDVTAQIIRGGAEKAREAGVVIAGGHTVQDKEPKFGLAVVGFVNPHQMLSKNGAHAGDYLFLTKPLGFGVTTTALKRELTTPEDIAEVTGWMSQLNRAAGRLARQVDLRGGTDVTGFSLLGHALEMADASGVAINFHYHRIPFISCARKYAEQWTFPGGASDNQSYFNPHVRFDPGLDEAAQMLLFDPQTSGGLLLAVPSEIEKDFLTSAERLAQPVWKIGEVIPGKGITVFP
jgi:selenide,water dikinase